MTKEFDPRDPGAKSAGSAHAAQGTAGAAGFTQSAMEGSIKQATDVNTEEALSLLQSQIAADAIRTADLYQSLDLAAQNGDSTQRMTLNNIATQALQNAVETANMVSKQAVRHSDLAIDRQWNVNETDYAAVEILRSNTFKDAIASAVAAAVAASKE